MFHTFHFLQIGMVLGVVNHVIFTRENNMISPHVKITSFHVKIACYSFARENNIGIMVDGLLRKMRKKFISS